MGLRIRQVPSALMPMDANGTQGNVNTSSTCRAKYTLIDLPIPSDHTYTEKWCKQFVPNLLAWAGSLEDPFGMSGQLNSEIINLWEDVFPDIVLSHRSKDIVIVQSVVCAVECECRLLDLLL
jgi:hypothetical protein